MSVFRSVLPFLRNSVIGSLSERIRSVFIAFEHDELIADADSRTDTHRPQHTQEHQPIIVHQPHLNFDSVDNNNNNNVNNNSNTDIISYNSDLHPPSLQDVHGIRRRVNSVLNTLHEEGMNDTERAFIQTVQDTASDPHVMSRIVNTASFQDFVSRFVPSVLFEQQQQIEQHEGGSSSRAHRRIQIVDEPEDEEEWSHVSPPGSPLPASAEHNFASSSSNNDNNSSERLLNRNYRRGQAGERSAEARALDRLNEICHQISPDFSRPGASVNSGQRNLSSDGYSSDSSVDSAYKPTMEGAGVPGVMDPGYYRESVMRGGSADVPALGNGGAPDVSGGFPGSAPPEKPTPDWANPVYIFLVGACVIPVIALAVTAVLHPSPRTLSLLRKGFKAVCTRMLA